MQRRIRVAALGAAVLFMAAAIAALAHDGRPARTHLRTAAAPSTTIADDAATTTLALPTTPSTAAPQPTTIPPPKPAKPAAPAPKPPNVRSGSFGPRPPGSVSFPYDPNRTSWTATINGIQMTLAIDRQGAPAGSPMTFTMTGTDNARNCCMLYLLFGDGTNWSKNASRSMGDPPPPGPGTLTATTTHPYNRDGRWEFMFQVGSNLGESSMVNAEFYGWIDITPGTRTANGPSQPTINGGWAYPPDGSASSGQTVSVGGHARDDDGFIHHFSIDWGDGTNDTSPGDPNGCRPTPSGWPAASDAWYPPITNPPTPAPHHTYAAPGDYTVTVKAHSIGCDGTDEQTAAWTATWHSAGPNP